MLITLLFIIKIKKDLKILSNNRRSVNIVSEQLLIFYLVFVIEFVLYSRKNDLNFWNEY